MNDDHRPVTPPPPPSRSAQRVEPNHHRPLENRARFARLGIIATLVVTAMTVVADVLEFRLYGQPPDEISNGESDLVGLANIVAYGLWSIAALVAGILFLGWFYDAYSNLHDERSTKHSPGWALGAWFIPFLNLWRPVKIMEELVVDAWRTRDLDQRKQKEGTERVWFWWIAYLAGWFFFRASTQVGVFTPEMIRLGNVLSIIDSALITIAGLILLTIIRAVTDAQTLRQTGARMPATAAGV